MVIDEPDRENKIMKRLFNRENLFRLLLVIGGLLAALVISEFGLRFFYTITEKDNKYFVYPPDTRKVFKLNPKILPGVGATARFEVNADGLRGDDLSPGSQYKIIAIGGSTTACLYIDQEKTWPYALQNKLNESRKTKVWVGNAGKAGLSTREHYMHMKYMLPQYPEIDLIIIMAGANDLFRRLIEDRQYDPLFLDHYEYWKRKLIRSAFSQTPYYDGKYRFKTGYYDQSAVGSLYVRFKELRSRRELIQDEAGDYVIRLRNIRKNASVFVDELPDLGPALSEYERNLNAIIDLAKERSVRLIFLTQPSILKPIMPQKEKDLICNGWIESLKSGRYYTEKVLAEGLQKYNDTLVRVCRDRDVECIDLEKKLPKNTTTFYDEVHFNDNGSLMTANIVYQYLKQGIQK